MALEAHENLEKIKPEELKEGEGKSPVSTQFFSTELNAAYEQLKKEKGDELGKLREHMGDVTRGAARINYEAVSVALQKSKNLSNDDINI